MSRIIPRRAALSAPLPTISGDGGGGEASGITFEDGFSGEGTFAPGNVVTIRKAGGGFGTKPDGAKPLHFASFNDNLAIESAYSRSAPSLTPQSGCTYQTTVKPAGATGCAKQDIAALGEGLAALYAEEPPFTVGDGVTPIKCYVYLKRFHDHEDNNGEGGFCNDKTIRFWGPDGSDESGHSVYYSIGANLNLCFVEGVTPDVPEGGNRFYDDMSFGGYDNDDFVEVEHFFKEGSEDTFDGVWTNARSGRLTHAFTNNWVTRNAGSGDPLMATFYLDQFSNGTYTGNIYFSDLYVDTSWARVMTSDTSDEPLLGVGGIGARAHRDICIPLAWSDDEITLLVRGLNPYLYVITDDDEWLKIGSME